MEQKGDLCRRLYITCECLGVPVGCSIYIGVVRGQHTKGNVRTFI